MQSYDYRDLKYKVPVSCNIINGDMPGIEYHLRSIRIACSIIAILIYIPILIKIYNLILKKTQSKLTYAELMNKSIDEASSFGQVIASFMHIDLHYFTSYALFWSTP
uniref:Uncharacterized protein n=1 Tax=Acrobeloides nanus TaxID=290746 RepID=A0A914E341_9BILA